MTQDRIRHREELQTAAQARSEAGGGRKSGRRGPRRWWFRPLALGMALALGLLIGEVGLRVFVAYKFSKRLGGPSESVPNDPDADAGLAEWVFRDGNPKVLYRFKPGARGRYMSMPVQINSKGLPDDEYADKKPPGTLRIIGLGDSTMFGFGIYRHERYMDIVEAMLGKVFAPDFQVEVIVNATPGWMAVQEIAAFHDDMLELDADAVVIQFDPNDVELPSVLHEPDFFGLDRAFLGALWPGAGPHALDELLEPDLDRIPRKYRSLVGWQALSEAYEQLKNTCDERDVNLVALLPIWRELRAKPDFDAQTTAFRALCRRLGIDLIDPNRFDHPYAGQGDLPDGDPALALPDDRHPSALGHALIARAVIDTMMPILAEGRLSADRVNLALELIEDEMASTQPPLLSRGLYHPEDWNGIPVRWTQDQAGLVFERGGAVLVVNYWVGNPETSSAQPVTVGLSIGSSPPVVVRHEKQGYYSRRIDLREFEGANLELRIEVNPLFRENAIGRNLGVGLYPLEFADAGPAP